MSVDPEGQGVVTAVSLLVQLPLAVWYLNQHNMQKSHPALLRNSDSLPSLPRRPTPSFTLPRLAGTGHCSSGSWSRIFKEWQKKAGYFPRGQGMGSRKFLLLQRRLNCNPAVSGHLPALLGFREISFEPPIHGMNPKLSPEF